MFVIVETKNEGRVMVEADNYDELYMELDLFSCGKDFEIISILKSPPEELDYPGYNSKYI